MTLKNILLLALSSLPFLTTIFPIVQSQSSDLSCHPSLSIDQTSSPFLLSFNNTKNNLPIKPSIKISDYACIEDLIFTVSKTEQFSLQKHTVGHVLFRWICRWICFWTHVENVIFTIVEPACESALEDFYMFELALHVSEPVYLDIFKTNSVMFLNLHCSPCSLSLMKLHCKLCSVSLLKLHCKLYSDQVLKGTLWMVF